MSVFCRCRCFLKSNIYLKEYDIHVKFDDEIQFAHAYGKRLKELGCTDLKPLVTEIKNEIKRRTNFFMDAVIRSNYIKKNYSPLYQNVYSLNIREMLHPDFLSLLSHTNSKHNYEISQKYLVSHPSQVYSFQIFKLEFCQQLLVELNHFNQSSMPKERPNSMNNHGILLDELGFNENLLIPLRKKFIEPLASLLFPKEAESGFDSHKAFTVDYEESKDIELGFHFDNSEVTLNVCLFSESDGGELCFGSADGSQGFVYEHQIGRAVLHKGSSLHCVLPLNAGRRVNLVMWMRNSRVRNKQCPMCKQVPDLEKVQQSWGEGFTLEM